MMDFKVAENKTSNSPDKKSLITPKKITPQKRITISEQKRPMNIKMLEKQNSNQREFLRSENNESLADDSPIKKSE